MKILLFSIISFSVFAFLLLMLGALWEDRKYNKRDEDAEPSCDIKTGTADEPLSMEEFRVEWEKYTKGFIDSGDVPRLILTQSQVDAWKKLYGDITIPYTIAKEGE